MEPTEPTDARERTTASRGRSYRPARASAPVPSSEEPHRQTVPMPPPMPPQPPAAAEGASNDRYNARLTRARSANRLTVRSASSARLEPTHAGASVPRDASSENQAQSEDSGEPPRAASIAPSGQLRRMPKPMWTTQVGTCNPCACRIAPEIDLCCLHLCLALLIRLPMRWRPRSIAPTAERWCAILSVMRGNHVSQRACSSFTPVHVANAPHDP